MRWPALPIALFAGAAWACEQPAADASRIAIAGGSITEIVYFLGEQDRIVATDRTSNYPAEALDYPSVGYVRDLSTEGLLSLAPTLILGEHDMGPPAVLTQIAATGVEIVKVPEVHTAAGIVDKVRCIARILGMEQHGEATIQARLDGTLEALAAISERNNATRPRVAVLLGLHDGVPLGAGTDTSGHGLIEMAAADNVFAGFDGWKPVSMEAMVQANPEYIVVPQRGIDDAGGIDELLHQPGLALTAAARNRNLIGMDGMSMLGFGPRTLDTALKLAQRLHHIEDAERSARHPAR